MNFLKSCASIMHLINTFCQKEAKFNVTTPQYAPITVHEKKYENKTAKTMLNQTACSYKKKAVLSSVRQLSQNKQKKKTTI